MVTNQQEIISVLIVGTHDLLRESLADLMSIQTDMQLVGAVFTPREAIQSVTSLPPDVILLDLTISEMESMIPIQNIHQAYPDTHIIAMSGFPRKELIENMLKSGVKHYIKRGDSAHSIVNAIRAVCQTAKEG